MYPWLTSAHTIQALRCLLGFAPPDVWRQNVHQLLGQHQLLLQDRQFEKVTNSCFALQEISGWRQGEKYEAKCLSLEINYINTKAFSFVMTRFPGHLVKILCILAICSFSLVRKAFLSFQWLFDLSSLSILLIAL